MSQHRRDVVCVTTALHDRGFHSKKSFFRIYLITSIETKRIENGGTFLLYQIVVMLRMWFFMHEQVVVSNGPRQIWE